jgi:hypothetical protein
MFNISNKAYNNLKLKLILKSKRLNGKPVCGNRDPRIGQGACIGWPLLSRGIKTLHCLWLAPFPSSFLFNNTKVSTFTTLSACSLYAFGPST